MTRKLFNQQIDGVSTNQGTNKVYSQMTIPESNQSQLGIRGARLLTGSRVRHSHSTDFFSLV